jgi:ankyrin repeat protein
VNAQGGHYGNALQAAASIGHLGIVQILVAEEVDVTIQPWINSRTSLLYASAVGNNYDIVKLLMDSHKDTRNHLKTQDNTSRTPLHIAIENRNLRIIECFLDGGASPDNPNFGDVTPFQYTVQIRHPKIPLLLFPKSELGVSQMSASD